MKTRKEVGFYSVVKGRLIWAFLALLAPLCVSAATLDGIVTHVSDGDTLWVKRTAHEAGHKIRILGIDAPEICQAFGPESRQALASLTLGKRVQVITDHNDKYGRALGRILLNQQDVGLIMVAQGYAWVYNDRAGQTEVYQMAQQQARNRRIGLWSHPSVMRPGQFRHRFGPCEGGKPRHAMPGNPWSVGK